ncbi:hypothetical protein [Streptomyces sp. G-G2]|uniref:hypothetical protein n=1 Tax=Streptomyces sp. G-G2 TaxID=3046201 RepID=UPI0024BBB4E4|nr:hypothetical protein [Streptomyces sp. G-G2]MDJ0386224.1 hypothetical protein [Streptomyces sp. G-G2]
MSIKRATVLGLAILGLGGCAPTTTPGSPSSPPTSLSSPAVVVLDERANHSTVSVGLGATIRIDLHSTYWSGVTSSAAQSVQQTGTPSSSPSASCRPGGGCGTVSTTFTTRATGATDLTSQRTSCGEAKPCAPDQQTYTVTIQVTG